MCLFQTRGKMDRVRPHTAPVQDISLLETHLTVQGKLLEELNNQANDLIHAVKNLMQKNS